MIPISKRMKAIADLVPEGLSVADIGCDHGFVAMYLVTMRQAPLAVAMDVNAGPLLRAKEHIEQYGLSDKIITRLSDGAVKLEEDECEAAVIAGMGGMLTIKILEESKSKFEKMKCFVLSPHSDIVAVRQYLSSNGYTIDEEDMVWDEGKYYSMFRCKRADSIVNLTDAELAYGPVLIKKKHPVLKDYLEFELLKTKEIKTKLGDSLSEADEIRRPALIKRVNDLQCKIEMIESTLADM